MVRRKLLWTLAVATALGVHLTMAGSLRAAEPGRADPGKRDIEGPTKAVVQKGSSATPAADANPKVEPGKVRWHPDVDTACAAAAKSGKPVMLFQMLGKLDEQFC